jgi:hypothetical protein
MNLFKFNKKDPTKYYLPSQYNITNSFMKQLISDANGVVAKNIGEEIESIYDEDSIICIHRTQLDIVDNREAVAKIFLNGLKNFGGNDISNTATPCKFFPILISQLAVAHGYKNNSCRGVIIVKIPKKDIGYGKGEAKPIWFPTKERDYRNIEMCILLPEYIYGYVECDVIRGIKLGEILKNPNYKDIHEYESDGLLFESGVSDLNYKKNIG